MKEVLCHDTEGEAKGPGILDLQDLFQARRNMCGKGDQGLWHDGPEVIDLPGVHCIYTGKEAFTT